MSDSAANTEPTVVHVADLNKYFERTGYKGSREPTLQTLRDVVWHHCKTFPFENLNMTVGKPIVCDLKSVEEKFISDRRGGWCFEHSTLLSSILSQVGYNVTTLLGRVLMPPNVISGNIHGILKVECEGKSWLVDCGFGPFGTTVPLEISDDFPAFETVAFPHRVVRNGNVYTHQAKSSEFTGAPDSEGWEGLYTFTMFEGYPADYEVGCWFVSTHVNSFFYRNVLVSKYSDDHRYVLFNKTFKYRAIGPNSAVEDIENREITTQEEYRTVLKQYFNIDFPEGTVFKHPGLKW